MEQTKQLKEKLCEIFKKIHSVSSDSISTFEESLWQSESYLMQSQYDIVVCGEVKKGKSSFINALLGQELLPVDVRVATSQVFRITNSKEERFLLKYIDGTEREISKNELKQYGSQIEADKKGILQLDDKIVDYIQVYANMPFLPDGVSIVDTPGLGALYTAHEQITQRYVSKAAAIVFVLDPTAPMTKPESEFIGRVLNITPYVMFVLTKIDLFPEAFKSIIRRNEDLLNERFEGKFKRPVEIYPISSRILFEASRDDDDFAYEDSLFPAAKDALEKLIEMTVALSATKQAWIEINKTKDFVLPRIKERINVLTDENNTLIREAEQKRLEILRTLEQEWGTNGNKKKEFLNKVDAILTGLSNKTQTLFHTTNDLYKDYEKRIDAIDSQEAAKEIASSLPSDLKNDIAQRWQSYVESAESSLNQLLSEYNEKIGNIFAHQLGNPYSEEINFDNTKNRWFDFFRQDFLKIGFGAAIASIILPIPAALGALAAAIGGAFWSISHNEAHVLEQMKGQLKNNFQHCFAELRDKILLEPIDEGRSPLQECMYNIKENARLSIEKICKQFEEQTKNEIDEMHAIVNKSKEEKLKEITELKQIQTLWERPITQGLEECKKMIIEIESKY